MVFFWVIFNLSSWILARIYMPWIKENLPHSFPPVLADLIVWFGVLVVIGLILIFFKKLFYMLFWSEISKSRGNQK
jgi:hypothetical protein